MSFTPRFTPNPDGLAAEFYAELARGALALQRCEDCRGWRHPPRIVCARCGSERWRWTPVSGRGVVYTWTVTHQPMAPPFAEDVPYAVVVVELEEGPRIVTAVGELEPSALAIGLPVEARVVHVSETVGLHYFVPRSR